MRRIFILTFVLLCAQVYTQTHPLLPVMENQLKSELSGWILTKPDGSVVELGDNWATQLVNNGRINSKSAIGSNMYKYFDRFDLSGLQLTGEMSPFVFTQLYNDNTFPADKKPHHTQAIAQNEDNPQYVTINEPRRKMVTFSLRFNGLTKIAADIPCISSMGITKLLVDHNELTELPDFSFPNVGGPLGGVGKKYGIEHFDCSNNNISQINVDHWLATNDHGEFQRGILGRYNQDMFVNVSNNRLNFTEIEKLNNLIDSYPNINYKERVFIYAPQRPIGNATEEFLNIGESKTIAFSLPHPDNQYQWYLNGKLTNYQDTTVNINSFTLEDAGVYICRVTNPNFPDLIIESSPIALYASGETKDLQEFTLTSTSAMPTDPFTLTIGEFQSNEDVFFFLKERTVSHSFRIVNGNTLVNAERLFGYYQIESYDIVVIAYDIYGNTREQTFTIVNDPALAETYDQMYQETLGSDYTNATNIRLELVMNSEDIDENEIAPVAETYLRVNYKLNGVAKSKPVPATSFMDDELDNQHFTLENVTISNNSDFDFEGKNKYNILVRHQYVGTMTLNFMTSATIYVRDIKEMPKDIELTNNKQEIDQPIGSVVGYVIAINEDLVPLPYTLSCTNNKFKLEGSALKTNTRFIEPTIESITIECENAIGAIERTFEIEFYESKQYPPHDIVLSNTCLDSIEPGETVAEIYVQDSTENDNWDLTVHDSRFDIQNGKLIYLDGVLQNKEIISLTAVDLENLTYTKDVLLFKSSIMTKIGLTNFILGDWAAGVEVAQVVSDAPAEFEIDNPNFEIVDGILKTAQTLAETHYHIIISSGAVSQEFDLYKLEEIGILENEPFSTKLFPNPVRDILNVDNGDRVEIFNIKGLLIHAENVVSNKINVSKLKPGIYIFKIHTDDLVSTYRVIKE